jgi:hypothetical protein
MAKSNDTGAAPPADNPPPIDPAVFASLQLERDKLADELVRLGNYLKQAGFTSEDGGPVGDVDIVIHHLGLKGGYMTGLEESAKLLVEAQDQVAALTTQVSDLQLALETAQSRARREVAEVLEADEAEAQDMEVKQVRGRRRLVPRGWPPG